jgi:hypothetical protein
MPDKTVKRLVQNHIRKEPSDPAQAANLHLIEGCGLEFPGHSLSKETESSIRTRV